MTSFDLEDVVTPEKLWEAQCILKHYVDDEDILGDEKFPQFLNQIFQKHGKETPSWM